MRIRTSGASRSALSAPYAQRDGIGTPCQVLIGALLTDFSRAAFGGGGTECCRSSFARGGCEQRRPPVGMTGPRREIITFHRITKFRRVWIGLIDICAIRETIGGCWFSVAYSVSRPQRFARCFRASPATSSQAMRHSTDYCSGPTVPGLRSEASLGDRGRRYSEVALSHGRSRFQRRPARWLESRT